MGLTVSMSRGRIAIEHDLRQYIPNNVDENMTQFNKVLIDKLQGKTLAEYTNEYMKPYIDEYNKKQRRSDRKKSYDYAKTYTEEQNNMQASRQNYTAGQLAYEYVIQFGDHKSLDVNDVVKDRNKYYAIVSMFEDFVGQFQEKYPHMNLVLATVHMDEPKGTPHMHILIQPIGEGYKQGLSHQVSLTKALACDGFERVEKKADRLSLTRWQDDVKDEIMEKILQKNYFEREYRDGEKYHMPVAMYKRAAASAEKIVNDARKDAEDIVGEAEQKKEVIEADYQRMAYGCTNEDGRRFVGYVELREQYKKVEKNIDEIVKSEAGKQALEKEKGRIVSRIINHFVDKLVSVASKKLIELLKKNILEPICASIQGLFQERGCKFYPSDKNKIEDAIDRGFNYTMRITGIGNAIEENMERYLPSEKEVGREVEKEIHRVR